MFSRQGFTLIEVLLVATILAMIAGFSIGIYDNYSRNMELESTGKNIIYDLRQMRAYAAAGVDQRKWGIHLSNGTQDYYELFSTPTDYADAGKTRVSANYLPATLHFVKPAEGVNLDIIFSSISGNTTADFFTVGAPGGSMTINVTASGAVY
ncbi:MAG: prepilin-type N-terminal cleavage/methylation domain-containing protein [Patescibacteria group bacterium]|nr:prepilin-type N-terminal cleavage/methylation domain-containing protein [Patescibacteria group bacterium]